MTRRPNQVDLFGLGNAVELIVVLPLLWGAFWLSALGAGPRQESESERYARRNSGDAALKSSEPPK